MNHFALPNPVRQVLCGPFTGAGSEAMAVTIGAPTCWGIQHWGVFTLTEGVWRVVLKQPSYLVPPLVAVGSGIRETTAVHRDGDSRCFPSGGTRSRSWRWNGSRLVSGPWKQVTPADGYEYGAFKTPSSNIVCDHFIHIGSRASESNVGCVIKSGLKPAPPRTAVRGRRLSRADRIGLQATGRAKPAACSGRRWAVSSGKHCARARLRPDLERRWSELHIGRLRADLPQQERSRLLPEPRKLASFLALHEEADRAIENHVEAGWAWSSAWRRWRR